VVDGQSPVQAAKLALRTRVAASRESRSVSDRSDQSLALAEHVLALPEVARATTVAAYVAMDSEPGTGTLLRGLLAEGKRVILPVLLPDRDLAWAPYRGDDELAPARWGILEPTGPRLGLDAIAGADLVLVPGLAVSPDGNRLGRGAGSFDRALARVRPEVLTCALLFDDEVDLPVPAEAHDRPVRAVATARGVTRFS
jgi:5-formyltetrahydrofolate cyclo-ligase